MQISSPVLFRDDSLIVLNKPSGVAVHRGWARDRDTLLTLARRIARQHVYPCHRLDRGTSGVTVFALSPEIATLIQQQFESQTIEKWYIAWVRGFSPESGLLDHAIARAPGEPKREARTAIRRLERVEFDNELAPKYPIRYSLSLVKPLTGRSHQIRRHLKHLSHPLVGDTKYGKSEHNRYCNRAFGLERLALHAAKLALNHPVTGARLYLQAALPEDLGLPFARAGFRRAAELFFDESPWRPALDALPLLGQ